MSFLLARFLGLFMWWEALAYLTYIPDHIVQITTTHRPPYDQEYKMFFLFLIGRVLFVIVMGWLVWSNARRIARWLEGKKEGEHHADAPPLSSP